MKKSLTRVSAYFVLLVLGADLCGCHTGRSRTAAGDVGISRSVHQLLVARSADMEAAQAKEKPSDCIPVSAGARRSTAATSNQTQGEMDLPSVDSYRPLSFVLHHDKPEAMTTQKKTRQSTPRPISTARF